MMLQTEHLLSEFMTVLQTFWRAYLVDIWNLNKVLTSFKGADIKAFIGNIPMVVNFLNTKFAVTDLMNTFCDALLLWREISHFIHIVPINDPPHFTTELTQFEANLASFYECGHTTFLTKNADGDNDIFYSHVLRFYLPRFAHEMFDNYNVGLGVFTMHGYEHQNKESKNTLKRFSNN
eukprot:scaffold18931_cov62-Attheya_sp.AAC.9